MVYYPQKYNIIYSIIVDLNFLWKTNNIIKLVQCENHKTYKELHIFKQNIK